MIPDDPRWWSLPRCSRSPQDATQLPSPANSWTTTLAQERGVYLPCSHPGILSHCQEPSAMCVHRSVTATQLNKRRRSTGDPLHSTPLQWSLPSLSLPSQGTSVSSYPSPFQLPQKWICHISSFVFNENRNVSAGKYSMLFRRKGNHQALVQLPGFYLEI